MTRIVSLTKTFIASATPLIAAAVIATTSLAPTPTQASTAGALQANWVIEKIRGKKTDLTKIPLFGPKVIKPMMDALGKLPVKRTAKSNAGKTFEDWPYMEFKTGKYAVTIFNMGNYGGQPRIVLGFTYNGTVTTGPSNWPKSGVWKFLPGMELKYPTVFYRLTGLAFSPATPVVGGANLKYLPGTLGKVADKAAKITRTLRIPMGALVLAGWEPKGALKTQFELMNFPTGTVYLMAGAGVDSFPPGATISGQHVDPMMESWRNARSFARGKKGGEDFVKFKQMLPTAAGYLKISVPGKWSNPMTMFDHASYATDAVLMFTYSGDVASWGAINNPFGAKKEYVYAIDLPAVLKGTSPDLMDIGFGLSFKELGLGDIAKAKLGMMTNLSKVDFIRKLAVLGKASNTNEGAWLNNLFGGARSAVDKIRGVVGKAIDTLPLNEIKTVNPKYVAYDAKNSEYPPSDSFNIYFSASTGITATGERGPILVTNGDFKMFGKTLASNKVRLSLKEGLLMESSLGGDITLGKVLGKNLNIEGKQRTKVEANLSHVIMKNRLNLNIVGVAKGEALMDFKLDNSGPKIRFKFDPTGGCAPPIPIKIDATIKTPNTMSALGNQILTLLKGVKFDSGGITNCAGYVVEWAKDGAKFIGKGAVIGGEYVKDGAKYAAKYGAEGAKYADKYAKEGAKQAAKAATATYNTAANAVSKEGKKVVDFAVNAGGAIKDFGKKVGCDLGLGGCSRPKPDPLAQRVSSPFLCPSGYFFSLEFRQCWKVKSSLYAYTGTPTDGPKCLTANANKSVGLTTCGGGARQQFHAVGRGAGQKLAVRPDILKANATACLVPKGGKFSPNTPLVTGSCANALAVHREAKTGRMIARHKNRSLCVRPATSMAHRSAHGVLADWGRLDGRSLDVSVDQAGHVFGVGTDGKVYQRKAGGWENFVNSPAGFVRLDGGIVNEIWAVGKSGAIHHFYGKWSKIKGGSTDIAAGGPDAGIVASLDTSYNSGKGGFRLWLTKNKGKTWTLTKGHGLRVDVDGAGGVWLVQHQGWVWHRHPTTKKWTKIPNVPGGARDISAGKTGTVMVTSNQDDVYALSGDHKKWLRFPGMGMNIAVGPDGAPVVGVDVGPYKGIVYAHKSATFTKGWKTVPQLDAFAQSHKTGDVAAVLDTCDPRPVSTAWSLVGPKVKEDYAAKAGMRKSFQLRHRHAYNNAWKRALGFDYKAKINKGNPVGKVKILNLDFLARTEYSAIFTGDNRFALYHHVTGMCLSNAYPSRDIGLLPCTFDDRTQLWSSQPGKSKGRRVIFGEGNYCLAPSLTGDGFWSDFPTMVHEKTPEWNKGCKPGTGLGWHMVPFGAQMSAEEFKLDRFYSGKAVMLQVKTTNACLDSGVAGKDGQAYQWQCRPGSKNHEFYIEWTAARDRFRIRNRHATNGNLCLEVPRGSTANGAAASQYPCSPGSTHHHWVRIDIDKEWFQLQNAQTRTCLDLAGSDRRPGGVFHMFKCNANNTNQLFRVVKDPKAAERQYNPDPFWAAQPVLLQVNATKACLDASVGQPARAKQWQCNPGAGNHKFFIKRVAKGAAFELRNRHLGNSNLCLNVRGASKSNGAEVVQWSCDSSQNNQNWTRVEHGGGWFSLKNVHSGKCLDLSGGSTRPGAFFGQYTCVKGGHPNQKFRAVAQAGWSQASQQYKPDVFLTGQPVMLQVQASGKCLDSSHGGNSANAYQYTCDRNAPNHKFKVEWMPSGKEFWLRNTRNDMCVEVPRGDRNLGTVVTQFPCARKNHHLWRKIYGKSGGWFQLQNVNSGYCLDLSGGNKTNGAPIGQYRCVKDHPNQSFRVFK